MSLKSTNPTPAKLSDDEFSALSPATSTLAQCACGCGRPVRRAEHRFIHGHNGGRTRGVALLSLHCAHCGQAYERYPSQVSRFCSRACYNASDLSHAPRAYAALKRDFFHDISTQEQAYILGFITADGSISRTGRRFDIAVGEKDRLLIERMQVVLGGGKLRFKRCASGFAPTHRMVQLEICSVAMVRDLAALGVGPNKTATATYPVLAPAMERHFVRGVWDGDGWIGQRQFMLVGTQALLHGVQTAVLRHTTCLLTPSCKKGQHYLTGSKRDRAVLAWLYEGATLSLARKDEAWRTYWTTTGRAASVATSGGHKVVSQKSKETT